MAETTNLNPFDYLLPGQQMTKARYDALAAFLIENQRAPTLAERETLIGPAPDMSHVTDPLPDGFAGRDWQNPMHRWVRRIVARV